MQDSLSTLGICPDPQAVHVIPVLSSTSQSVILPGNKCTCIVQEFLLEKI